MVIDLASGPATGQASLYRRMQRSQRPNSLATLAVVLTWVFACTALSACKAEPTTVEVPFDGVDLPIKQKTADPAALNSAATAGSRSTGPSSLTPTGGEAPLGQARPRTDSISACCASLHAAKAAATNPASKSGLAAAANSCETQRIQLEQGKVTRGQALNAVRLSLLDDAPGTCR